MTISYAGPFWKVLIRWKGSIWKACWLEIIVFLLFYYSLSFVYRFILDASQRVTFENVTILFHSYTKDIPITFLLGFYVSTVVRRWWQQFEHVSWPDDLVSLIVFLMPGTDELVVQKRRTMARYIILATALCWRDISKPVLKRFPTIDHFVKTGLMTAEEQLLYQSMESHCVARWFLPLQWCQKLVQAECHTKSVSAPLQAAFLRELSVYKSSLRKLYCFDWVCLPLVYTQVASLVTYGFIGMCIVGRQFLNNKHRVMKDFEADLYIPVFSILQLLFYVGWFKVAQYLLRPFGSDDDDLELNYLLDRHIQVAFAIVDAFERQQPSISKDIFNGKPPIDMLPHTMLSLNEKQKEHPPKSHVHVTFRCQEDADLIDPCLYALDDRRMLHKTREF